MNKRERLSGNEAIAFAMKQINLDVMGAFPITPSTEIPQYFSSYVANGEVDTSFVAVESEHSAMSFCIGASAAGARVSTATSSCGLALMWELLYVASSMRLPIPLAVVNRALTGPININNDHSDSMGARDSGWIQLYAENNQEAYDNYIQSIVIAETCHLPIMVCQDGFITSHAIENIELLDDASVKDFVQTYQPEHALLKDTMAIGAYATSAYYMECKRAQKQAMMQAVDVIQEVAMKYQKISGRGFAWIEPYEMSDAEYALVVIGSSAGTAKVAIQELRVQGIRVGLVKIRMFRPFPTDAIVEALQNVKVVAVLDKAEGFSCAGGPLFSEVRSALYASENHPTILSYIYGLGGRDVRVESMKQIIAQLLEGNTQDTYHYVDVRGGK